MSFHQVLLELPLVFCVLPPEEAPAFLLGHVVVALKVVAIGIEDLPRTLNMGLVPVGLDLSAVGEGYLSEAVLLTVHETANVSDAVGITIFALTVLLPLAPHAVI